MSLHMYCKTRCFGTATQRVLFGSFHEHGTRDMILVKNSSLEYCSIFNIDGKLVHSSFEQPAFGTILDARLLKCEWADDQEEGAKDDGDSGIKVATDAHEDDRGNSEETRGNVRLQCLTRKGHARINGDHVAMLISDYGELVFCTVVGEPEKLIDLPYALSSTGRFECVAEVMLGKPGLDFTTTNKKLALDPWSRAVAIASYQDQIDVLVLKSSMSRTNFSPVANTVSIEETGIIWHLEFLHTKSNQRDRILLAAIVYSDIDRVCRVVLYNIDTSNPEAPSADLMGRLPMDQKMALPVLFFSVPFYPETLVLVTEEAVLIVRATDITSGNVFLPGAVMGRTIGHHLCTAYTLCANESDPRVYLGTTEGQLIRLDIHDLEAIALSCVQKVNPIGQHMQALDYLELEDNDGNKMPAMALYTVGEGTNSQLLAVTDDEAIELQAIENRAPVVDAVDESNAHTAFKMTTCSGKDQDAQLNTVTYGCNTDLMDTVPDWNGVTNLWTLNGGEHGVFLVGSSCYDTKIARVHNESDGLISTWPAIATSSSTIHTELMYPTCHKTDRINAERDALIVQVLANKLLLLDFESPDPLLVYHFKEGSKDSRTTAVFASVQHVFQEASHLLLCCTEGDQTGMHRVYVDYKNKKVSRFEKQTDTWFAGHPSCFFADQFVLAFIGDYNGNLHMYNTGMDAKPWKLLNTCNIGSVVHSVSMVTNFDNDEDNRTRMIISTRNGEVRHCQIGELMAPTFEGTLYNQNASLTRFAFRDSVTYAFCPDVLLIRLDKTGCVKYNEVVSHGGVEHQALSILPFNFSKLGKNFLDAVAPIAVVVDGRLTTMHVDPDTHFSTRPLNIGLTPRKMLVETTVANKPLVVLAATVHQRGRPMEKLVLMDPRTGKIWCDAKLPPGQSVCSLAQWRVTNKGKDYNYICVGTRYQASKPYTGREPNDKSGEMGCFILYRLKCRDRKGAPSYSLRLAWQLDEQPGAVNAICPRERILLFSAGSHLNLYRLDEGQEELQFVSNTALNQPITSIRSFKTTVTVSMFGDSVVYYTIRDNTTRLESAFYSRDTQRRNVQGLVEVDNGMVLAVTQEGHILWMECDMYPSFSPGPRNRFQRRSDVHVKASWHYPEMLIKPHLVYGHLSSVAQDDQYAWFRNWQTIWGPYSSINKSEFCSSVAAWTISGGLVTAHLFSDLMAHLLEALQMQLAWRGPTRPILGNSATFWYWHRAQSGDGFESTLDGDLLRQYLRLTDVEKRALIANDFDAMPVSFSAQTSQLAAPTMPSLTEKAIDTYNELYLGPLHLRELFEAQNRPWPVETRDSHLLAFQTDVKDTEWTLQFLDHIMRGIELFC